MLRLRDVVATGASTMASGGFTLLLAVVAARLLGPEQNGHFAQFSVILALVSLAFNLGLGPASTYFIASGAASSAQIARLNLRFVAITGAMAALVALLIWSGGAGPLQQALRVPAAVAAIGILGGVALLALNQAAAVRMGRHEYAQANSLNVLRTAAPLPLVVLATLVHPKALTAAGAQAAVLLVVALVAWSALRPGRDSEALPAGLLGRLVRFGAMAYFANLLHYVAIRGLILLLSYSATPAAVGFANLALLLVEAMLLVPSALGQLLFPQSSHQAFEREAMESVLRLSLLVAMAAALFVGFAAPALVELLLGAAYAEVGSALRHLAPSIVLMTVPRILSPVLSGSGRPQVPLVGALLSVAIGTPLALWWMPSSGLIGAMWVVNAVSLCTVLVSLAGYAGLAPLRWFALLLPRRAELAGWWVALRRVAGRLRR